MTRKSGAVQTLLAPTTPSPRAGVTTPALSVIVVNYRSWEDTRGLIATLRAELDPRRGEILVVNNCRRTHPEETDCGPAVRFVESVRNVGFAGGVNLGAACARGHLLLILNPDVRPHPGAVAQLLEAHARHPEAGVLVPRLLGPDGQEQASVRSFYRLETILAARTPYGRTRRGRRVLDAHLGHGMDRRRRQAVDWGLGAAMLIDPARIPRERGRIMDDRFFLYLEDVDLCLRTWRAGGEVLYVPEAVFTHRHRRESRTRPLSMANMYHALSLLKFVAKYGGLPGRPAGAKDAARARHG